MNGRNGLNALEQGQKITIKKLVECNGNWFFAYVYNNYGYNFGMLLPMMELDHLCAESYINSACMQIGQGSFEEQLLVDQWLKDHPHTPFIVYSSGDLNNAVNDAINNINKNLERYKGDWEKFTDDAAEFDEWRNVVYYVSITEYADHEACYNGYKSLISKAKKLIETM